MKVLILSTATGQGHNSAAAALQEYFDGAGVETVTLDVLKSGERNISGPVSRLYEGMTVHAPWFFGFLYHLGELVSSSQRKSPIYYLNSLYAKTLYRKILFVAPDIIVCPHIFGAQVVTYIKRKYPLSIPTAGIMTDYTCSPFWEETELDHYIIPAQELAGEFVAKGMPARRLHAIGIPVKARFARKAPKAEARAKFGFTAEHVFLIMGGSMGYGRIREIAAELLRRMPQAQVAAACGHNRELYRQLQQIPNVFPFPFIDDISLLMDAADVLLTKPGGLSSTEAMIKRIPVVFTCPIPGCETRNAEFLSGIGAALCRTDIGKAAEAACLLALSPERSERMMDAQRRHFDRGITQRTVEFLLNAGGIPEAGLCVSGG